MTNIAKFQYGNLSHTVGNVELLGKPLGIGQVSLTAIPQLLDALEEPAVYNISSVDAHRLAWMVKAAFEAEKSAAGNAFYLSIYIAKQKWEISYEGADQAEFKDEERFTFKFGQRGYEDAQPITVSHNEIYEFFNFFRKLSCL